MEKSEFWKKVRKVAINKFAITLYVFAIVFVFIGDQSLINQLSRAIEMRSIRKKIAQEQAETARAINVLESLNDTDSLERFAREQYYMHTDNEIVYIVEYQQIIGNNNTYEKYEVEYYIIDSRYADTASRSSHEHHEVATLF